MMVVSTNIGIPRVIRWKEREVVTGLFKDPVDEPIFLGSEDVKDDHVIDRRYHGGIDKACYLYSANHYDYWEMLYPDLSWQWGMFGENLTVEGLDESAIRIGDVFRIGDAAVQVTQPRQPCFKLGVRFGTQEMVRQFEQSDFPGVYVRILKEGLVKKGDSFILMGTNPAFPSVKTVFNLLFSTDFSTEQLEEAAGIPLLAESCRRDLLKRVKKPSDG